MHWQRHKQGRAHAAKWGSACPSRSSSAPIPPSPTPRRRRCRRSSTSSPSPGFCAAARADGTVQDGRPQSPGRRRVRLEGYVDNERPARRRAVRRSYRRLQPRGLLSHVSRHCVTPGATPIYAATVVGKPPMEDAWLGKATERIFLPLLQMVVPEIVDYNLPVEGGFHNLCIVSVKKSYPGQAKKVMNALWGLGHMMMLTRCLIVVDHDVDVHDVRSVAWYRAQQRRSVARSGGDAGARGRSRPQRILRRRDGPQTRHRRDAQDRRRRLRARLAARHRRWTRRPANSSIGAGTNTVCARATKATRGRVKAKRRCADCSIPQRWCRGSVDRAALHAENVVPALEGGR